MRVGKVKNGGRTASTLRLIEGKELIEKVGILEIDCNALGGTRVLAASRGGRSQKRSILRL